ncbi:Ribonuclease H-like domain [Plasmopara halstedii]|uniref:Ribonuclease H-like domain n=1 Tax=Plasmopara halstedii TaxID=4781 RepID=A0A0P1AQK6_PLAHL|nr:Ribonuclease H-like domain [Plasmopara halstedii]CEG43602.1 Ribonuclease H-like domain [Plasmopara halstedii]|eukprot:XP_024579971.1 Ribonuclease H-like domain [Plasmopara halstedii]
MSSLKEELRQLYSLIAPVGALMQENQGCSKPNGALALLGLVGLQLNTMSAAAPLQVIRPSRNKNGESKEDAFFAEHHMLEETVCETRRLIEKAFKNRFFVRYDPELFPETSTKKDKPLRRKTRAKLFETVKKTVRDNIKAMVIRAATKLSAAGGAGFENAGGSSSSASNVRAPRKSLASTSNLFKCLFDKRAFVVGNTSVGCSLETLVGEEIESFVRFTPGLLMPHDVEHQDVLDGFWIKHQGRFPRLAAVARYTFGNSALTAGIERDFGIAGVLLNPRRNNLDTFVVEMILFLNINGEHTPWDDIPLINSKDVQQTAGGRSKFAPKRYTTATPAGSSTLNEEDDENNAKADRSFTAKEIENDFDFFTAASIHDD